MRTTKMVTKKMKRMMKRGAMEMENWRRRLS